mmetsp:Transcript_22345/g.56868  ORF Transcript_22345/g.56868 Transcript_22345/m.56868 type:complete len:159 (-) Transcript_22345:62-538(-)|eukprot:CAMPEP_0202859748 /NCGR_PEP_ID=MMETSP1391-20130828/1734_1 /ASSEMBLY_ACC=CAM_ASM_000867 /TAXON_ID=1034604 /ORGANISM="Chlamydomonas leiostraca, Strain SAG 11-49" /LENGTH=158 /DNA_ID=CAMNT_0049538817 /DNA_START=87 /DNA_END=563 /DNA_ORIENTATION=-
MAKMGEGDPRWIVEHRDDGKNVNGWHWEEKSILQQVKSRIGDVFSNVEVDMGGKQGSITITSCKECTGEAHINTRKGGKKLVVYDLKITLEWKAAGLGGSDKEHTGTVKVEEFASGSDEDDLLWEWTGDEGARKVVEGAARPTVVRLLSQLGKEMDRL